MILFVETAFRTYFFNCKNSLNFPRMSNVTNGLDVAESNFAPLSEHVIFILVGGEKFNF